MSVDGNSFPAHSNVRLVPALVASVVTGVSPPRAPPARTPARTDSPPTAQCQEKGNSHD